MLCLMLIGALGISCLAGCSTQATELEAESDAQAQIGSARAVIGYEERSLPLHRSDSEDVGTIALRFYDDAPSVPYIGLKEYYRTFLGGVMEASAKDGRYTFTEEDGTVAVLDVVADTFATDDFDGFASHPAEKEAGKSTYTAHLAPYLKVKEERTERAARPVTLDFSRYGIDAKGDDGDTYLPLATLNDLFETSHRHVALYNGEDVYFTEGGSLDFPASGTEDIAYASSLAGRPERTEDMALFSYRELCFAIDAFYGLPGSAPLNDAVADRGLDEALGEADPQTRDLLNSSSTLDYARGLARLLDHDLDDKGHTSFTDYINLQMDDSSNFVQELAALEESDSLQAAGPSAALQAASKGAREAKQEAFGEDAAFNNYYIEKGDTALFSFRSFKKDEDGWASYYDGGALPIETDSYAALLDAVRKADANPAIRNFVIDVSTNAGGEPEAAFAIAALTCAECTFRVENTVTGQQTSAVIVADRNADGCVDEADGAVSFDLRFAVLASGASYSSANYLAQMLHEKGVPILGERSGGGPCSVRADATADGWRYSISSSTRLCDDAWENVDAGVPADIDLSAQGEKAKGAAKYAAFYDMDKLSESIDAFYARQ